MNGWRYEWVAALPVDVYDVLLEEMIKAQEAQSAAANPE
jgi:hypothetical protein